MKTCSNCKTDNKDVAKYCKHCGAELPYGVRLVVLALLAIIASFVGFKIGQGNNQVSVLVMSIFCKIVVWLKLAIVVIVKTEIKHKILFSALGFAVPVVVILSSGLVDRGYRWDAWKRVITIFVISVTGLVSIVVMGFAFFFQQPLIYSYNREKSEFIRSTQAPRFLEKLPWRKAELRGTINPDDPVSFACSGQVYYAFGVQKATTDSGDSFLRGWRKGGSVNIELSALKYVDLGVDFPSVIPQGVFATYPEPHGMINGHYYLCNIKEQLYALVNPNQLDASYQPLQKTGKCEMAFRYVTASNLKDLYDILRVADGQSPVP